MNIVVDPKVASLSSARRMREANIAVTASLAEARGHLNNAWRVARDYQVTLSALDQMEISEIGNAADTLKRWVP